MDFDDVIDKIKDIAITVCVVSGAIILVVSAIAMVGLLFK